MNPFEKLGFTAAFVKAASLSEVTKNRLIDLAKRHARLLQLLYHPDRTGDNRKSQEINEALQRIENANEREREIEAYYSTNSINAEFQNRIAELESKLRLKENEINFEKKRADEQNLILNDLIELLRIKLLLEKGQPIAGYANLPANKSIKVITFSANCYRVNFISGKSLIRDEKRYMSLSQAEKKPGQKFRGRRHEYQVVGIIPKRLQMIERKSLSEADVYFREFQMIVIKKELEALPVVIPIVKEGEILVGFHVEKEISSILTILGEVIKICAG
jgi:hypothetical protein